MRMKVPAPGAKLEGEGSGIFFSSLFFSLATFAIPGWGD